LAGEGEVGRRNHLKHTDSAGIYHTTCPRIKTGIWVPEDRISLALALNMRFQRSSRAEAFDDVLTLVKLIPSEQERDLIGALLLGLTDRILTQAERDYMKRELHQKSLVYKESCLHHTRPKPQPIT